ncbi:hypothetical protein OAQ99_06430 [Candidatus Kapabacteria bacterium]|nr:hypothetical protein [Candidatus Kapabacteria bacterium]
MNLPLELQNKYKVLKKDIQSKLKEFSVVKPDNYFYELCFCICTPQSKAESAFAVQTKLIKQNFLENDFDPTQILRDPKHYIRFHNQKAKRLIEAKENWILISSVINSEISGSDKRAWLYENVKGIGMKESAHFLRNIGYRNLGILDRHILKHLVSSGVFDEIPNISSRKNYEKVEKAFADFADKNNIPMDELDLLFWSYEAGLILK